jgi:uncharacterized membrane protein YcjF (UPF0283 family)
MRRQNGHIDAAHRHVSAALGALAECFPTLGTARRGKLAVIAQQLVSAQQELAAQVEGVERSVDKADLDGESEDERIERKAEEAAQRVDEMLAKLLMTAEERDFSRAVGEQLVDVVTECYLQATRDDRRLDGACITAAVAVALVIVHDAPDEQAT